MNLTNDDYVRLFEFRQGIRRFLQWSEEEAALDGLTPAQHQLLLAVRASTARPGPTIGDISDSLLLRHHSAVGLVDRAEQAGLVERRRDESDHRVVRVALTPRGRGLLKRLALSHLRQLRGLAPAMAALATSTRPRTADQRARGADPLKHASA